MLFAIHAYESEYEGLHGIEDYAVVDCIDEDQANAIGFDMSNDVIESYCFDDYDYDEADFYDDEEHGTEWDIHKVKETTKSLEELNTLYYNDPIGFVSVYCEE